LFSQVITTAKCLASSIVILNLKSGIKLVGATICGNSLIWLLLSQLWLLLLLLETKLLFCVNRLFRRNNRNFFLPSEDEESIVGTLFDKSLLLLLLLFVGIIIEKFIVYPVLSRGLDSNTIKLKKKKREKRKKKINESFKYPLVS
jgi:Na+/H+ antiporter NhaD/arsenite permease-like protein